MKSIISMPTCGFSLMLPRLAQHAVAAVLGVGEPPLVEHVQEAGRAGAQGRVALAAGVGGADEGQLHPADELDHRGVEVVEDLVAVEAAARSRVP